MFGRFAWALLFTACLVGETRKQAFHHAVANDPRSAATLLPSIIDEPWVGQIGFLQALAVAHHASPELQERFLTAAARHNPTVAIREVAQYGDLEGAAAVFETAAMLAPDDAVSAASGRSNTAARVAAALHASARPELRLVASLLSNGMLDDVTRPRAAVFVPYLDSAKLSVLLPKLADDAFYFRALADTRVLRPEAPLLDRAMETFAQTTLVAIRDGGPAELGRVTRYSARDLYLLLTYGRTEGGAGVFAKVYDVFLAPKLRRVTTSKMLESARYIGLRHFLSIAAAHERFDSFLRTLGTPAAQTALLSRVVRNLESVAQPLDQTIAAAEVLDAVPVGAGLEALVRLVRQEHERVTDSKSRTLYGILAVRLSRRLPTDTALAQVARSYFPHVRETRILEMGSISDGNTAVQRYLFWNDDDGVESFDSFKQAYSGDPRWRFEQKQEGYVEVTGKGSDGRRILIFANVPADILSPANRGNAEQIAARQKLVTEVLAARGLRPLVIVHRGHSYHLQKSLPFFTPDARLIYLGSCNGMDKMASVAERATSAQVIATRGVGAMAINDPVLKAINDELLDANRVEWEAFWSGLGKKLGGNPLFRDYIGPHQNAAASLLAAYYEITGRD